MEFLAGRQAKQAALGRLLAIAPALEAAGAKLKCKTQVLLMEMIDAVLAQQGR